MNSLIVRVVAGMCEMGIELSAADRIDCGLDNVGRVPYLQANLPKKIRRFWQNHKCLLLHLCSSNHTEDNRK